MTPGTRVRFVMNFLTRVGSVVRVQKDGRVIVLADEVVGDKGRRVYASQRFTVDAQALALVVHSVTR
jgi:hypothetical protein